MAGSKTNGCWHELARVRAPLESRSLWHALLDKTEHPERYNPEIASATLLDQDPEIVLRRTVPVDGKPFTESVHHACRRRRVEYQRHGQEWKTAQAVVEDGEGTFLVYEVNNPAAALADAGIDSQRAQATLEHLVVAARNGNQEPRNERW